jgi:hypothetical protein
MLDARCIMHVTNYNYCMHCRSLMQQIFQVALWYALGKWLSNLPLVQSFWYVCPAAAIILSRSVYGTLLSTIIDQANPSKNTLVPANCKKLETQDTCKSEPARYAWKNEKIYDCKHSRDPTCDSFNHCINDPCNCSVSVEVNEHLIQKQRNTLIYRTPSPTPMRSILWYKAVSKRGGHS